MKKREKNNRPFFSKPDMEVGDMRLFPDDSFANAASATECTGLIQVPAEDDEAEEAYEDVYSFRMNRPIVKNKET